MTTVNYDAVESIKARYRAVLDNYEEGNMPDDVYKDTVDGIEGEFECKLQAMGYIKGEVEGDNDYIDKEIKRLERRKEINNNKVERIKRMAWDLMETFGKTKVKTPTHTFAINNNGGVKPLVFLGGKPDLDAIDERFVKVNVKKDTDNEAIREALDNGEVLDFVAYGERGKRLDIR